MGIRVLFEPFAGGAAVALRRVLAGAVERAVLVEREPGVAAFWKVVMGPANYDFEHMCALVRRAEPTGASHGQFMGCFANPNVGSRPCASNTAFGHASVFCLLAGRPAD